MKPVTAITKNIRSLLFATDQMQNGGDMADGFGVASGLSGVGKTWALAYALNARRANTPKPVLVRATQNWTMKIMLSKIAYELGYDGEGTIGFLEDLIITKLQEKKRLIMIDEADYILPERLSKWASQGSKINALRDISDLAASPVLLVGEERVLDLLSARQRFPRRILQVVKFEALDLTDARAVVSARCEVDVDDELLSLAHADARGSIAYLCKNLEDIEQFARVNGLRTVTREAWGVAAFSPKVFDLERTR